MKLFCSVTSSLLLGSLSGCAISASPAAGPPAAPVSVSTSVRTTTGLLPISQVTEVPVEKGAPHIEGHPLTSVVVTQCNLIVAVYMTMPDGRLLRFDHTTSLHPDQLMTMAYSATRSERVEVSCNDSGVEGFEKHEPV